MTPGETTRRRLVVAWTTPDPAALARRLATGGFTLEGHQLRLPSARIVLVDGTGPERLIEARSEADDVGGLGPTHPNAVVDLLAIGWATVDLERALVGSASGGPTETLPDDELLGGRAVRIGSAVPATIVLEPTTEGRLAASLARVGEGPAVLYLTGDIRQWDTPPRPGPYGPSVLVRGGPAHGPHLVVVASEGWGWATSGTSPGPPGTIRQ